MENGRTREQEIVVSQGEMLIAKYLIVVDLDERKKFTGNTVLKKLILDNNIVQRCPFLYWI